MSKHKNRTHRRKSPANIQLRLQGAKLVTDQALKRLIRDLRSFGNEPSETHQEALRLILSRYSKIAAGVDTGRFVYPLFTGGGKTRSIISWISTVESIGNPWSVAVSASQVEQLCELKRALIKEGVPAEKIGLIHSYKYNEEKAAALMDPSCPLTELPNGYASEPASDPNPNKYQYLLLTHQRIKAKGDTKQSLSVKEAMKWNGRPRSLLIYDESLLKTSPDYLKVTELRKALSAMEINLEEHFKDHHVPEWLPAFRLLEGLVGCTKEEINRQTTESLDPRSFTLKIPDDVNWTEVRKAIKAPPGHQRETEWAVMRKAVDLVLDSSLRVITKQGLSDALITYDLEFDSTMDRVVVLDASFPVRVLEQLDSSLKQEEGYQDLMHNSISYENTEVRILENGAGRSTISRGLFHREKKLSAEIARVINEEISTDEGIIIFTYKDKPDSPILTLLKDQLRSHGVDLSVTLEDGTQRVNFLTWGSETSLNSLSHCQNVILAGVLHLDEAMVASWTLAQSGDIEGHLSREDVEKSQAGEILHRVYQALSRGCQRVFLGHQTKPMRAWITMDKSKRGMLMDGLPVVMPGVSFERAENSLLSKGVYHRELAQMISQHLKASGVEKLSSRAVKEALIEAGHQITERTWKLAREYFTQTETSWKLRGRSFVQVTSNDYGF